REAWRRAVQLERAGDVRAAAAAFERAAQVGGSPALEAEASLGRARSLLAAGDAAGATATLQQLYAEASDLRDRYGFRIGDLAALQRIQIAAEADPSSAPALYRAVVNDVLATRWVIGRP